MPRSNPKALVIYIVDGDTRIHASKAMMDFVSKGHFLTDDPQKADVIIGPRCWRIDPLLKLGDDSTVEESLERQLKMMEAGVRAIKYPKTKDKEDVQKETHS